MSIHRKQYSAEFKAKIALEAIKGQKTINELAAEHSVHPTQISTWKKQMLEGAVQVFDQRQTAASHTASGLTDRLYQQIGQLQVELEWLKRKVGPLR